MKPSLILPVAGKSSRFPNVRPKWLLTHPNGKLMLVQAISGIDFELIEKVYVVMLKEHEQYISIDGLKSAFERLGIEEKVVIITLKYPTKNQPETVYNAIKLAHIEGPIIIKDSDNYFKFKPDTKNSICTYDINNMDNVCAHNKSYISKNPEGFINNIVEKKIISSEFCCGGYSFESTQLFKKYFEGLRHNEDLYISHMIFQMILEGNNFECDEVDDYVDWGTLEDWNKYKAQFKTLFLDIDGVLVENSGEYFSPKWGETEAIEDNVKVINELYDSGKVQIILTTCRTYFYENATYEQLEKIGLKYHNVIFALYHGKRYVINDYSKTNPYKSCEAINIKRNDNNLKDLL